MFGSIAVKQIVRFLRAHAHPSAKTLPANVVDPMVLWAGEDKRVAFREGRLVAYADAAAYDRAAAAPDAAWTDRGKRRVFHAAS